MRFKRNIVESKSNILFLGLNYRASSILVGTSKQLRQLWNSLVRIEGDFAQHWEIWLIN